MAKPNQPQQQPVPMPHMTGMDRAPEVFMDGVQGVILTNGVVKLNLYSEMSDPNGGPVQRTGVARLGMSIPVMVALHGMLGNLMDDFREKGIIVEGPTESDTRQ